MAIIRVLLGNWGIASRQPFVTKANTLTTPERTAFSIRTNRAPASNTLSQS